MRKGTATSKRSTLRKPKLSKARSRANVTSKLKKIAKPKRRKRKKRLKKTRRARKRTRFPVL